MYISVPCLVVCLHPEVVSVQGDHVSAGAARVLEGDDLLARPQPLLLLIVGECARLADRLGVSLL